MFKGRSCAECLLFSSLDLSNTKLSWERQKEVDGDLYLIPHSQHQIDSALRWAAMRAILMCR